MRRAIWLPAAALAALVPPSPAPAGFIADVPDLLAADAQATLNRRIGAIQAAGHGDIGIAILPSIADRAPVEVAVAIYRTWRVGRIDSIGSVRRNVGALLLIVPKELAPNHRGECWITSGTGAEGSLTDAAGGRICRDSSVPYLRNRDYAGAVGAGVEAIAARLAVGMASEPAPTSGEPGAALVSQSHRRRTPAWAYTIGAVLTAIGAVVGAAKWRRLRPRRCATCGQCMRRLPEAEDDAELAAGQQLEERLKSVDYDVWRCPSGHELILPYQSAFSSYQECSRCHVRAEKTTRQVITEPTYIRTGLAEDTHLCASCHASRTERVTLPRRTPPSSSSGGGGGGGSSGGGRASADPGPPAAAAAAPAIDRPAATAWLRHGPGRPPDRVAGPRSSGSRSRARPRPA